jgi:hypothetical protein
LAAACRAGPAEVKEKFGIGGKQGEGLAALTEEDLLDLAVLALETTTHLELNIAAADADPVWRWARSCCSSTTTSSLPSGTDRRASSSKSAGHSNANPKS